MNKLLLVFILMVFLSSCRMDKPFNKARNYYKAVIDGNELYLTFIKDTIVAINSDSLKSCGWNFMVFKKSNTRLFKTDELKIDTIWIKPIADGISLIGEDEDLAFKKIELPDSKKDSLSRAMEIVQGFKEKGITVGCEYSFKEVSFFYERAIQKAKEHLKNPSSAKFKEAYIHKYKFINDQDDYVESTTTVVSLDVDAKNGFGNFTEDTYYVYFIPKKEDKSEYDIEFSDSPLLNYALEKRVME